MAEVTLPQKIDALLGGEWTYKALAQHAGCDISTISRIRTGAIANPSYSVGVAIDALYEDHKKKLSAA